MTVPVGFSVFGRELSAYINTPASARWCFSCFEDYILSTMFFAENGSTTQIAKDLKEFYCRVINCNRTIDELTAEKIRIADIESFLEGDIERIYKFFNDPEGSGIEFGSLYRLLDYFDSNELKVFLPYAQKEIRSLIEGGICYLDPFFYCCRSELFISSTSSYVTNGVLTSQLDCNYHNGIPHPFWEAWTDEGYEKKKYDLISPLACYVFIWYRLNNRLDKNDEHYNLYRELANQAEHLLVQYQLGNGSWPWNSAEKNGDILTTCMAVHALAFSSSIESNNTLANAGAWLQNCWIDNDVFWEINPAYDSLCIDSLALCYRKEEMLSFSKRSIPIRKRMNEDMTAKDLHTSSTIENHFHGNTNIISSGVNSSVIIAGDRNEVSQSGAERGCKENNKKTQKNTISNRIFISHRSVDKNIADMLFDFFIKTGIPREVIFCSSLPGNDAKQFISAEVRKAIQTSQINIAILSKDYYESAYCVNEAGVMWYLDNVRVIPITLPEITSDEMIGFLNKEYKPRCLDNSDDIAYIYDTITDIIGIPQQKASVVNIESKKLIEKYTDYIANKGSLPISPAEKKLHSTALGITIIKYDIKNSLDGNTSTYQFDVIFCNQAERTLSVYEKYLHFYKGDKEIKKEEVIRYEVHRRKDDLDDLLIQKPVNRIITLDPGHAEQAGIIRNYDDVKEADKVTFTCIAEKQEYEVVVFSKNEMLLSNQEKAKE